MKIYKTKSALKEYLASLKKADKSIGFVPTMGALHQGHLSLIKKAKQHNAITVVSIFVNPTQFDNQEDLVNYPKTIDQDIALLESVNCEVLFLPSVAEIYDNNITADTFNFDGLEHQMEGEFRDGHFDGVGTIVKSLFEIVAPNTAYFGKKDFQQLQIIKKLVKKHQIPVKVKGCAIFREEDGLAMSSRNSRLSEEYRDVAPFIYRTLKKAKKKFGIKSADKVTKWVVKKFKKHPLLRLEYFTIASEETLKTVKIKAENEKYRAFIAVFAGDIRLIDNIRLK
ncbi:pantoate--beta-alanine ligase [Tenacibaculum finnmarkense genomovar finnmarkense]|uniref:pantoate--beta-alanine ligase n=1 Tax=Tenacibaculum finnmarkense TaxID=2781243 RepID=UPI000C445060|nr:pantoate--beta-alanine ligase [Tenacibaculum finnmarkense]MBE7659691.1 pantoate--beta-alanine ligase [Tenacibaculum finnmarkense genomovar finnmarkense]MBE7691893.1 pantoate--beta-alanine ligase [Tenacibaculum finnmarkense genomovar finnmarkense]MCD8412675.1 pantoate--beta-alanine ligase [Tenacibaculum finnmarkense genomovar ulcerans]MCD8417238.1 pantoate--beta-alanine ligase [Tenacibaculum finnmarkense genomovar finnmarkense]MCD8446331.1 pantoate--beta-alanine ligase [Tenacibaculum finnmar